MAAALALNAKQTGQIGSQATRDKNRWSFPAQAGPATDGQYAADEFNRDGPEGDHAQILPIGRLQLGYAAARRLRTEIGH